LGDTVSYYSVIRQQRQMFKNHDRRFSFQTFEFIETLIKIKRC